MQSEQRRGGMTSGDWRWERGSDAERIHALLCASDAYTATPAAPAPVRNIESTRRYIAERAVHVLWFGKDPAAMFTLVWTPPFATDPGIFPPARKPAYITRLAVDGVWLARGTIVGARAVRHAIEVARAEGADALRSEANPDITGVWTLLHLFGFVDVATIDDGERRRAYLQKTLTPALER